MGNNILEPIANGIFAYCKWFYSAWFEDDSFNFNEYFKKVQLKNKENVYPKQIKSYEGSLGRIYLFNIPIGLSEVDFEKHKKGIEAQLRDEVNIRLKNGFIEIEVNSNKLSKNVPYRLPSRTNDGIYIPIGESLEGTVGIDLKENPHSYIVGTTGSGKSVCTKGILTSLSNTFRPHEVELYLCDLKMVELALFRNLKHTKKFVYTVPDTTEVIADLLKETKERYELFVQNEVTDIYSYNELPNVKKLKYKVLFIEEIVILLEDKSKKAMKLLKQLMAISRACGIFCFLTTQRPSSDIIDNVVKSLITNRIVFAVEDEKNSNICLDSSGADKLDGKGHGILKVGPSKVEFQSYFISDKQIKQFTKHLIVKKSPLKGLQSTKKAENDISVNKTKKEPEKAKDAIKDLSFLDNL